jgi:hypothetical protein
MPFVGTNIACPPFDEIDNTARRVKKYATIKMTESNTRYVAVSFLWISAITNKAAAMIRAIGYDLVVNPQEATESRVILTKSELPQSVDL